MELLNIRYIVPAVRDFRVQSSTSTFQRRAPKLDYAKAQQRWWVHLRLNSDIDLMILEKAVTGSDIRLVELKGNFYLEDPRIPDSADMDTAYDLAESLLAQLNGATQLLCPHFQCARIESMIELLDNGTGRGVVRYGITVHGSSNYSAIWSFLNGEPSPISAMLSVWKSDKDVQDALFYLGAEGNVWANLYKACEIVKDYVRGVPKVLFHNSWCSRSEWDRFHRTANHHEAIGRFSRHAKSRTVPPPDPMTVAEARSFAGGLVNKWIQSLTAGEAAHGPPAKS